MALIHILPNSPNGKLVPVDLKSSIYAFDGLEYLGLFNKNDQVIYIRFMAGLNNKNFKSGLADKCQEFEKIEYAALIHNNDFGRMKKISKEQWCKAWREFKMALHEINVAG